MNFLDHLEQGVKFIFKALNLIIGLIVGAVFGALLSIVVMLMVSDGFSFSSGWYWRLLPGVVLGALAGIKLWPLMLGLFIGGDADLTDVDSGSDWGNNQLNDTEVKGSDDLLGDANKDKDPNGSGW